MDNLQKGKYLNAAMWLTEAQAITLQLLELELVLKR